jgi:hypothetical protein
MNDQCHEHFSKHQPDPRHHDKQRVATGIGFLRRSMAGALLATAITATAVGLAATGHADDAPAPTTANCKTDQWGFHGSQRRTLCDGPLSSDGSWSRERTIWVPAHYSTPICTYSGRSSYSSHTN